MNATDGVRGGFVIVVEPIDRYTGLTRLDALAQLRSMLDRLSPAPGMKQQPFTPVETLLCYGLFFILDPHRYGGRNMDRVPAVVGQLAAVSQRSPRSILSKMLNLDGTYEHGARAEPALLAILVSHLSLYRDLYVTILSAARELGIMDDRLPDFLGYLEPALAAVNDRPGTPSTESLLLGQEELPSTDTALIGLEQAHSTASKLERALGDEATERLLVGRVRLTQHRFARGVLANCGRECVFCGFSPRVLPERSGLLRASHIKPWVHSAARERSDIRNGLAACPIHDAAFDGGYITVVPGDQRILRSSLLETSIKHGDPRVELYFRDALRERLELPAGGEQPHRGYLTYHLETLFRG